MVIVSMGLLVTMLALGILRLRAAAGEEQGDDPELELGWESGEETNITVNPLEVRKNNLVKTLPDSLTFNRLRHNFKYI